MISREMHMKITVRFQLTLKSAIANMYINKVTGIGEDVWM